MVPIQVEDKNEHLNDNKKRWVSIVLEEFIVRESSGEKFVLLEKLYFFHSLFDICLFLFPETPVLKAQLFYNVLVIAEHFGCQLLGTNRVSFTSWSAILLPITLESTQILEETFETRKTDRLRVSLVKLAAWIFRISNGNSDFKLGNWKILWQKRLLIFISKLLKWIYALRKGTDF